MVVLSAMVHPNYCWGHWVNWSSYKILGIKGLGESSGESTIGIKSPCLQPLERVHLLIEAIVCGQQPSMIHAIVCSSCLKVVWRFERRTVYISSLRVRTNEPGVPGGAKMSLAPNKPK
jgi:hypothetical protein